MNDDQPLFPPDKSPGLKKPAAGGMGKPAGKPLLGGSSAKVTEPAPTKPAPAAKPAAAASTSPTPSFEFEDSPPPKAKSKPSAPAAADAGPALNPFADQAVSVPVGGSASGPSTAPSSSPSSTPEDEIDIRPGAAKDLWACPHCGARNKPSRTTCRECNKMPSDDIVVPWHKKPKNQAAVAGGVVLLILLFMLLTHHDTSLHPAGAADLDDAIRFGGGGGGERSVEGHTFHGRGTLSVSGRVASISAHGSTPGVMVVVMALGHLAVNDEQFNAWKIDSQDDNLVLTGDNGPVPSAVLYLIFQGDDKLSVHKGDYLSINGDYGYGESDDGHYIAGSGPEHPHTYTVVVTGHRER